MAKDEKQESIFKVLDELIFHLNTTRSTFSFLIITSFILAPLALIVAGVFTFHPRLLFFLLQRAPEAAGIVIIFLVITVILASVWLAIGIKERQFFSRWNNRFGRFMSLRERMDRELSDDAPPKPDDRPDTGQED